MKALLLSLCLVCFAVPASAVFGQSAEVVHPIYAQSAPPTPADSALSYAPRPILLLSGKNNVEAVMPMEFTENGKQHLEFVPSSQIKDSMMQRGGKPIRLGDVLSALGGATQTINQLQAQIAALKAENEKLWMVAMKNNPNQPPPTVVVQQPPSTPGPSQAEINAEAWEAHRQRMILAWAMLQNANRPQTANLNVRVSDCTRLPALCAGR